MAKLRVDKIAAPIVKDEFTGSVFFDGTTDFLSLSSSTDFAMGTGDFTAECFIYTTSFSNAEGSYSERVFDSNTGQLGIYVTSDGSGTIGALVSGTDHRGNGSPTLSGWTHVALTRSGSTVRIFLNGVLDSSFTNSGSVASSGDFLIGARSSGTGGFLGYISNFRICKGHAVYTGNFTPPTRELEVHTKAPKGVVFPAADNRTVLLACQDAYNPLTEATGRHTITGAGNLGGVPGQELVTNGQFGQNTNNWTADADATLTVSSQALRITVTATAGATQTVSVQSGAKYILTFDAKTDGTNFANFQINNNGTFLYNGNITSTTFTKQGFQFTAASSSITIKPYKATSGWAEFDNISISAVHPVTDANPGLLRKTNITSTITENTGSVFFDGNADHLKLANSTDFNYGSGDFSIEVWVYLLSSAGGADNHGIASNYITSGNRRSWLLMLSGATPAFLASSDGTSGNLITVSSSVDVADETWTHIAVSRTGTTLTIYVNGVQQAQNSSFHSSIYSNTDDPVEIGGYNNGTNTFEGYISNLRICKGHQVYKSNFIPPIRELEVHEGPDDDRTVLLACYDGENIFADKTGRHIIAAYGDRLSSPTPTATDSPIGITTNYPPVTRNVDPVEGPTFGGGVGFVSQNWLTLPKGTTTDRNRTGGRGLLMGGYTTVPANASLNTIRFITISSSGNSQDFGDLTSARYGGGGCGSSTRGIHGGGVGSITSIDHVTIASSGDAISFGSLDTGASYVKACSNQTRGIWGGGRNPNPTSINVVQYVTIATLGNSQDFGILTSARTGIAAVASPTRGIFSGGYTHPSPTALNTIDYVTIATTGNALDFGDLLTAVRFSDTVSSGIRGVIGGGSAAVTNTIQYITISTLGNAQNFGDLIVAREHLSATDNSIRGVFSGGVTPTSINNLDYVTIASTGDAADFGDLQQTAGYAGGTSDSHGGLS